jgi:hypothetical protein
MTFVTEPMPQVTARSNPLLLLELPTVFHVAQAVGAHCSQQVQLAHIGYNQNLTAVRSEEGLITDAAFPGSRGRWLSSTLLQVWVDISQHLEWLGPCGISSCQDGRGRAQLFHPQVPGWIFYIEVGKFRSNKGPRTFHQDQPTRT